MKTVDEKIQEKISEWKNGVDMEKLNDKEKVIHHLHLESLDVSCDLLLCHLWLTSKECLCNLFKKKGMYVYIST